MKDILHFDYHRGFDDFTLSFFFCTKSATKEHGIVASVALALGRDGGVGGDRV